LVRLELSDRRISESKDRVKVGKPLPLRATLTAMESFGNAPLSWHSDFSLFRAACGVEPLLQLRIVFTRSPSS